MSRVDSQHWQQVKELFEAALEQPVSERSQFLDRACGSDGLLRDEVESLLRSHDEAGSFLETPAVASAAESLISKQSKLSVGQKVKHYEILALIGEGGMGEVYLAKDTILGRQVAVKLLPEYLSRDPDRLRRFKQEARTASTLSHPNVCVIHEIGESSDGRPFIAMEYIEGITLRQRMNDRRMKLGDALDFAIQVADALTAAHEAGIIHRDIKPENIMIRRDGYLKVLDFGLAKLTGRVKPVTDTTMSTLLAHSTPGMVMGTTGYMSPEQARGVPVDMRTDIWSLGVILYEMVSGQPPFAGATPTDVVVAIIESDQPPLAEHVPEVPVELERIVRKALRKSADERYQIVKEMAIDLRSLRRDMELDLQLERSVAPSRTGAGGATAVQYGKVATGKDRILDTAELEDSRLTTARETSRIGSWPIRIGLIVLGTLLLAGAAFGIYKIFQRTETKAAPFQRINVSKLTTSGTALFASISPDGKYVAYVRSEGGKQSLWLRQVESAGQLEIVPPTEGLYYGLLFSPEGNFIYYGYAPNSDSAVDIYKVPVLGMGANPVKVNPRDGPAKLSHDGKRIAFVRHDHEKRTDSIVVANADGSNEQTLVSQKWPDQFVWDWVTTPVWTPDDQRLNLPLVKSDSRGFYVTIYEVRVSDRAENTIALSPQRFEQPGQLHLLSDASGVIMSAKAQGASFSQIWYLGRDGSAKTITNDLSDYRGVTLTANSKSFITIQTQTLSNIWLAPKDDTTHAAQITSGVGRYFDLSWASDGKILYASDASGSADIFEMATNGGAVKQLTSGMNRNYAPDVSPDNRFIVLHSNRSGIFQIWRMDRDGSNPVQLTTGNSESNWPQFSADSRSVIYQHFESGVSGTLWRVPVEGGPPQKIVEGFAVRPALSPDGKWLGFWHNEGQANARWRLGVMALEGERQVKFFDVSPTVQVQWDTMVRWGSDSRSLTYLDHRRGIDNLWAQSIDGGPPKQLTNFTESAIFSFDWSREGQLVASRGVLTTDVVLISDADSSSR
jgi:eukaryotic-like serine/threonine-protein kinase